MPRLLSLSFVRSALTLTLAWVAGCAVYDPDLVRRRDVRGDTVDAADGLDPDAPADGDDVGPDITDAPVDTGCGPGMERCGTMCVDTRTDPMNCGRCGTACGMRANAAVACVSGMCQMTCDRDYDDCDNNPANGCEAHLSADVQHCGTCPTACAGGTNAMAACDMGVCRLRCLTGFADCDRNAANGCEAALDSPMSCGTCMNVCPAATPLCTVTGSMGMCTSGCSAGQTRCGTSCVNTQTDANNCGACGTRCPSATNATPSCAAGVCGITCATGFGDCDRNTANGCETDLSTSTNCGACGMRCASSGIPFTTPSCNAMRMCTSVCTTNRGDCDMNMTNGCETALDLPNSCGTCTTRCPAGQSCAGGGCCTVGTTRCGTATTCTNLASDAMNCGRCGTVCSGATPICCNSVCAAGPTCTGRYTVAPIAAPVFVDVCAAASHRTVLPLMDDASINIPETTGTPLITIPFQIRYYNTLMAAPFTVSTNGWLALVSTTSAALSGTIPSATLPNGTLAPMWTDLYTRTGICYGVSGVAPSRRFVVQWQDMHYCCTADPLVHLTFEVIINEVAAGTSNTIDFIYSRLDGVSRAGTVGLENQTGTAGTPVPGAFGVMGFRFTYVP